MVNWQWWPANHLILKFDFEKSSKNKQKMKFGKIQLWHESCKFISKPDFVFSNWFLIPLWYGIWKRERERERERQRSWNRKKDFVLELHQTTWIVVSPCSVYVYMIYIYSLYIYIYGYIYIYLCICIYMHLEFINSFVLAFKCRWIIARPCYCSTQYTDHVWALVWSCDRFMTQYGPQHSLCWTGDSQQ